MENADVRYAQLSPKQLKRLRKFEDKIGTLVLAVEPATRLADLTDDQVSRLQALEEELGVMLLAYQAPEKAN
jgi:hypothetical protein